MGSSTKTSSGRPTRAMARPSRCCWPPDRRRYGVRPHSWSASRSTSSSGVERVRVQPSDVAEHLVGADPAPGAAGLQHHADPGHQSAVVGDRVEPEHADPTLVRAAIALAGLQRRRLAGAVGAEHGGDGVARDLQGEAVDGRLAAVGHAEIGDLDGGRHGRQSTEQRSRLPQIARPVADVADHVSGREAWNTSSGDDDEQRDLEDGPEDAERVVVRRQVVAEWCSLQHSFQLALGLGARRSPRPRSPASWKAQSSALSGCSGSSGSRWP